MVLRRMAGYFEQHRAEGASLLVAAVAAMPFRPTWLVIPAKAGIQVDFERPNGFPLSRE
jgi:hypothetical protein